MGSRWDLCAPSRSDWDLSSNLVEIPITLLEKGSHSGSRFLFGGRTSQSAMTGCSTGKFIHQSLPKKLSSRKSEVRSSLGQTARPSDPYGGPDDRAVCFGVPPKPPRLIIDASPYIRAGITFRIILYVKFCILFCIITRISGCP